ncbi:MAG: hypothetical protein LIO51_02180 [Clostridiales bacterium]|nr:hypothetical protein [Clostridiales bacterium]
MSGYTVTFSISAIDEFCDNPTEYKTWQIREALNDARVHYEYGNASKNWYDYVVMKLTPYSSYT